MQCYMRRSKAKELLLMIVCLVTWGVEAREGGKTAVEAAGAEGMRHGIPARRNRRPPVMFSKLRMAARPPMGSKMLISFPESM